MESNGEDCEDDVSVEELCRLLGIKKSNRRKKAAQLPIDIENLNFSYVDPSGNIVDCDTDIIDDNVVITTEESVTGVLPAQSVAGSSELTERNSAICDTDIIDDNVVITTEESVTGVLPAQIVAGSSELTERNSPICDTDKSNSISASSEESFGNLNENRKRKSKGMADKKKWKQNENKKLRMEGKQYVGYRREIVDKNKGRWKAMQDTPREARKMGPACNSTYCAKSKFRSCSLIPEQERKEIFEKFWDKMSWEQKRQYLLSLIDTQPKKQVKKKENSRRSNETRTYFLKTQNGKLQVCQKLFLSTFGIKEWTIRYWMERSDHGMISNVTREQPLTSHKQEDYEYLKQFLRSMPKMPSHYCRQSTSKLYLEPTIPTISKLFDLYCNTCTDNEKMPLSRWAFDKTFNEENLSLFHPKKDECDTCCAHTVGNVSNEEWEMHTKRKEEARSEKNADKVLGRTNQAHVFTQDVQAVKLCPQLQASALYFKLKLCVHNFTMYNIGTKDVTCFWFDETNGGLVASVFTSCIIHKLTQILNQKLLPVILYSDGCAAQNRNVVLSNALLELAMEKNVIITQKFLEKGHTQMECDSVHSAIEAKIKNREIFLLSQYTTISKEARPSKPYESLNLDYSFFTDYSMKKGNVIYDSIRPGKNINDPTVTDLRVLQYSPDGTIKYKLHFSDNLQDLPRRAKTTNRQHKPKLYQERIKISANKWKHLQELKHVIPSDCHDYYNLLPHDD